ncbi:MAG: hypothetical protein IT379_03275 [Deltaproteobacteria bacterium]|nr:hypothetical protein [Deltaproteobacteria bacterium]
MVLHNTVVKNGDALGIYTSDVFSRQLFRNNLLIGGPGGDYNGYSSGSGRVMDLGSADSTCDLGSAVRSPPVHPDRVERTSMAT